MKRLSNLAKFVINFRNYIEIFMLKVEVKDFINLYNLQGITLTSEIKLNKLFSFLETKVNNTD